METLRLLPVVCCMLLLAACGDSGSDAGADASAVLADSTATGEPAPASGPQLQTAGSVRSFPDAGFTVYWPSGCARLKEQVSSGPTRRAAQEFIYNCDRDGTMLNGVGIRVLQRAHDPDGAAPHPRLVVELVERQLSKSGTRILRQRPLEAAGNQGVDVQAAEPEGAGEIWIRGILAGPDIYMLMAWGDRGGLFEEPEIIDFFASFRIGVPED